MKTSPQLLLVLAALAGGCAASSNGGAGAPDDSHASTRRVTGEVAQGDPALGADTTLASATDVEVADLNASGDLVVRGTASIADDGSFDVDVSSTAHSFLVLALDASGEVIGGATVTTDDASATEADAGTIT